MYQIVLTGPESTGKSTLAQALAKQYKTDWIPEYARSYIENLNRPYEESDLLEIAKGQYQLVENYPSKRDHFLFIDTHLLVIKVWSEYKYGSCHPWIIEQLKFTKVDLYILCGTDVAWEYDPQREHPHQRNELLAIYRQQLMDLKLPFVEITGNLKTRLTKVEKAINILTK